MRLTILSLLILTGLNAIAAAPKAKVTREVAAKKTAQKPSCQQKVEQIIRSTARAMGETEHFGLDFTRQAAGYDIEDIPLTSFSTGTFKTDEGYLSESGAVITVRDPDKKCEIVRVDVRIGG